MSYDISEWTFEAVGSDFTVVTPTTAHFVNLSGSIQYDPTTCTGSFDVSRTVTGGCCEIYRLTGSFTDAKTFTGSFSATFCDDAACGCPMGDGVSCGFSGCASQTTNPLTGIRP